MSPTKGSHLPHVVCSLLFFIHQLAHAVAATPCYFPDHQEASSFYPCNESATQSSCCRDTEVCLSNGYCLQQTGLANRISRGACTDQTFSSAACPSECTNVATSASLSIFLASDSTPSGGGFCCAAPYNTTSGACGTGTDQPFTLPEGTVIANRKDGTTLQANQTLAVGSVATVTTTVTATITSTANNNNSSAIAAGIAVPLGVLLLASLTACGILWSKLKNRKSATSGEEKIGKGVHVEQSVSTGYSSPKTVTDQGSPSWNYYPQQQSYTNNAHGMPVEAPFDHHVAEVPADREVMLADSRAV